MDKKYGSEKRKPDGSAFLSGFGSDAPASFESLVRKENVYVHVPFCHHLCNYCAFEKSLNLKRIPQWLDAICREAGEYVTKRFAENPDWKIGTLYFGGGTPSILSWQQLERLAGSFIPFLDPEQYEWTIEVNPETLEPGDLLFYRKLGINRLSVGIQSFQDDLLASIGRRHSGKRAREVVLQAREAGFSNISCDLIFALPGQSFETLKRDVEEMVALFPEHISIYSLQLEENSVFGKTGVLPVDEDLEAAEFEWLIARLKEAGYEHYEISSFAKDGHYSSHNLSVWMGKDYAGIGHGACGRDNRGFYHHEGSLAAYSKGQSSLQYDEADFAFTDLMLAFRTQFGIGERDWNEKYSGIFQKSLQELLEPLCSKYKGCFERSKTPGQSRIFLNERGREILNTILADLLEIFEPD